MLSLLVLVMALWKNWSSSCDFGILPLQYMYDCAWAAKASILYSWCAAPWSWLLLVVWSPTCAKAVICFWFLSSLRFARSYANLWRGCSASKWSRTLVVSHLRIRTLVGSSVSAFITLWFSKLHPTFRSWLHTSSLPSESIPVGSTHWCVKPNLSPEWPPFKRLAHFHASERYPRRQGVFDPKCAGSVTARMRFSFSPSSPAYISVHPPHTCTLCLHACTTSSQTQYVWDCMESLWHKEGIP